MGPNQTKIGTLLINGEPIGAIKDFEYKLDKPKLQKEYNPWLFNTSDLLSFTCTLFGHKRDHISKALGNTHYAKKGMLFRKK